MAIYTYIIYHYTTVKFNYIYIFILIFYSKYILINALLCKRFIIISLQTHF